MSHKANLLRTLLPGLVVAAIAMPLRAEDDGVAARAWLERMARAVETLSYDGTFIVQHEQQIEAMQILHYADAQGEFERLRALNGVAREIVRDNDRVTCYLPDERIVRVDLREVSRLAPVEALRDTQRLAAHYDFRVEGASRMAGEPVHIIAIRPRDALRYGYRFWLHRDNALPLKSALIDEAGMPVEQTMFTELRLRDDLTRAALPKPMDTTGYVWQRGDELANSDRNASGDTDWRFTALPRGYKLTQRTRHTATDAAGMVEHLMVGDGLASVSVYVEPLNPARSVSARNGGKLLSGASHMGAVNAYGLRLSAHHVTAVGEAPPATVRSIAEALRAP
jgi:sigma-E factor negative regulatory protein RseB